MSHRRYYPRSFGLLFAVSELGHSDASHFIEGTLYQEDGQPGLNASGRAEVRRATGTQPYDYDSLLDLAARIGLTQAALNTFVSRVTATVNRN